MFQTIGTFFGRKPPQKTSPSFAEAPSSISPVSRASAGRQQTYTKIFRWRLPDGQTKEPALVQVVGSFNHWQPIELHRDGKLDSWHVMVHHIPGNRTHHYMLLVDGKPAFDKTCDGLAVPHGPHEEQYQMPTDKGPRVLMMFAQTK
jgi:hypothetical protein